MRSNSPMDAKNNAPEGEEGEVIAKAIAEPTEKVRKVMALAIAETKMEGLAIEADSAMLPGQLDTGT